MMITIINLILVQILMETASRHTTHRLPPRVPFMGTVKPGTKCETPRVDIMQQDISTWARGFQVLADSHLSTTSTTAYHDKTLLSITGHDETLLAAPT